MTFRLFIIAAVVLVVFAIIAFASTTAKCLGIDGYVWVSASLLAFYTDLLVGGWVMTNLVHRPPPQS
jgi:hypothetical protein